MFKKGLTLLVLATFGLPAHALLVSVSGSNSDLGVAASIIAAPSNVNDDAAYNEAQEGFDEQQGVLLSGDLAVDDGLISAGTVVDSHMIFLNSGPGNTNTAIEHFDVEWEFSGIILGVMSNNNGSLEVNSSSQLGATGTLYPGVAYNNRGLESRECSTAKSSSSKDCYSVSGNMLTLSMRVTEPGDWIRVITASAAPVPEPISLLLMSISLLGLGLTRRVKK